MKQGLAHGLTAVPPQKVLTKPASRRSTQPWRHCSLTWLSAVDSLASQSAVKSRRRPLSMAAQAHTAAAAGRGASGGSGEQVSGLIVASVLSAACHAAERPSAPACSPKPKGLCPERQGASAGGSPLAFCATQAIRPSDLSPAALVAVLTWAPPLPPLAAGGADHRAAGGRPALPPHRPGHLQAFISGWSFQSARM